MTDVIVKSASQLLALGSDVPGDCRVKVVREDPSRRVVFVALKGADLDALERAAWSFVTGQSRRWRDAASGNWNEPAVRVVESGIWRGPDSTDGAASTGDWIVGLHLRKSAWSAYRAGHVAPPALFQAAQEGATDLPLAAHSMKKGHHSMPKTKTPKGVHQFSKSLGAGLGAYAFRELEDALKTAESPAEQLDARRRLALAKMMAQDHSRAGDPGMQVRRMRGLGEPLFTNSHALPDDRDVRGI